MVAPGPLPAREGTLRSRGIGSGAHRVPDRLELHQRRDLVGTLGLGRERVGGGASGLAGGLVLVASAPIATSPWRSSISSPSRKGGEITPTPGRRDQGSPATLSILAYGHLLAVQHLYGVVNFCVRAVVNFSMREHKGWRNFCARQRKSHAAAGGSSSPHGRDWRG